MVKLASMTKINQPEILADLTVKESFSPESENHSGKRIVLTTFGSFGDLHPYLAIALELKARGHHPIIATSSYYRDKIEAAGISFYRVRPDIPPPDEHTEMVAKIMDLKTGPEFLFKELLAPNVRVAYEDLKEATKDADLLVTHVITYAGPILAQKTGIPWISTVLAPASFFSAYDPIVPARAPSVGKLLRLHPLFARAFLRIAKRMVDKWIEPIYAFRAELGLPRGLNPVFEGQHSPSLVLALYSKLFGEPQADWPAQTRVTGFPFYDKRDEAAVSPDLEKFLDNGPAPIVFTLGSSAIFVAEDFYRQSIEAARKLNRRAVILIGDARNMPKESLPDGIAAFDYAPYGMILPRAAAIVHQGGVGTTAQALRAGVPTLIVPFSNDQPDNAAHVERLGVGRTLRRSKYKAARVAKELGMLLADKSFAEKAAEVGRQIRGEDGARNAAEAIETFVNRK